MVKKGSILTEEHRMKVSNGMNKYWSAPINRLRASQKMKEVMMQPDLRIRISTSLKGRPSKLRGRNISEETKLRISLALKGKHSPPKDPERAKLKLSLYRKGKPLSQSAKSKLSEFWKGKHFWKGERQSPEHLAKLSVSRKGKKKHPLFGYNVSKGLRAVSSKLSHASKKRWQTADYVIKQMRARGCKPNKAELLLQGILDERFPNEWKYTGDGQLVIGGKCPDFANVNGKKDLIELFGNYWHSPTEIEPRKAHYKEFGYNCTIIWGSELKDEALVISKILKAESSRLEEEA